MKFNASIRLQNASGAYAGATMVTVEAPDITKARLLVSQQYGVNNSGIYSLTLVPEETERVYQSSSWSQPATVPVVPEHKASILPLVAAATAGYVVGRASIPPVVVAPVRDWDQEQRDREDQRDWDANADFRQYQREQQRERDQRDYDREMVAYRKLQLDPIYQMAQAEISRKWKIECAERQAKEAIVVVYTAEEIAVRQRQQIELDKQYRELNGFPPAYNGFLDYCWAKIQALGIILLVGFGLFGFILLGLKFANLLR
jgi:hypothetical protein